MHSARLAAVGSTASVVLAALITAGCAAAAKAPVAPPPVAASPSASTPVSVSAPSRHVGDLFVHRFSGSFSNEPLTLTEEVAAREDAAWVVDFSLTQSEKVDRLRVRFDVQSGQAVSASHFVGGKETPATLSDYEALLARTVYSADVNDGLLSQNDQTCVVGADELACQTKTYKVWIGEAPATLSVVHSSTFADRDVSGEITTEDGKLIYRAELVEARQGRENSAFASALR